MNANELAEIIEHLENARYIGASKAATMLRQQQEKLTKYELRHAEQRKRIDEQQAEIEALKAHPVKELTDEEIEEVAVINLGHSMGLLNWMGFARAILRKAQNG